MEKMSSCNQTALSFPATRNSAASFVKKSDQTKFNGTISAFGQAHSVLYIYIS